MLPKEEMRLIAMRYFQRRTQTDIAQELGISQDELAEKIFVSRQSISNFYNYNSYTDIYTLLLLAETFGVSLDELIKGDVEEMKEEINAQERAGFNRDTVCFAIFGIVTVLSIAPLYAFLDYIGCLIWALIVGVAGYFCGRVELTKRCSTSRPTRRSSLSSRALIFPRSALCAPSAMWSSTAPQRQ